MRLLLALLALLIALPALAALAPADLAAVDAAPPPGAALPLDRALTDERAQATTLRQVLAASPATLVLFVDYTCESTCGAALAIAAASLADPSLADLHAGLAVIGIDPKDDVDAAAAIKRGLLPDDSPLSGRARFLVGDAQAVAALLEAAGYRVRYDPDTDQFAHPAVTLVVDTEGHVGRALPSLSLGPGNLRLALVDTGRGAVGGLLDRIAVRCYAFDPATGLYTSRVTLLLRLAGAATLAGLAAVLILLARRRAPRTGAA